MGSKFGFVTPGPVDTPPHRAGAYCQIYEVKCEWVPSPMRKRLEVHLRCVRLQAPRRLRQRSYLPLIQACTPPPPVHIAQRRLIRVRSTEALRHLSSTLQRFLQVSILFGCTAGFALHAFLLAVLQTPAVCCFIYWAHCNRMAGRRHT